MDENGGDKSPRDSRTCAIIGGGPAGLMAADVLSRHGIAVTIYDQMPSFGRKFLMAGRGGLNLTHSEPLEAFLTRYQNADWLAPAIAAFPPDSLRELAAELGEPTFTGSSGRVFPKSFKASPFLRALLRRLLAQGVEFRPGFRLIDVAPPTLHLASKSGEGLELHPDAAILALGGASWPRLGSDGQWAAMLAAHQVEIAPLMAANCGYCVEWSANFIERFAGAPLKTIAIRCMDEYRRGEAMITASGIEGGLVYGFGPKLRQSFAQGKDVVIHLDLRPDITDKALETSLSRPRNGQSAANFLRKAAGLTPLSVALLHESGFQHLPKEPQILAALIKAMPLRLTGPAPLARAISTAGGVMSSACTDALMLKSLPGFFVAGEMLDWDAPTGGYLLQAAFATGAKAAHGALAYLSK
ncbi:MAG: TIGR03862 family flavoprotein [Hyphomicrobiales bacterium]|nr:TIGR03862 family flavoprotein [Hyphomicrobiales bacterium]